MFKLVEAIAEAEKKWLSQIINHIEQVYNNIHLPSHDVAHHLRVWNFCKQILAELIINETSLKRVSVEDALIASLFHDTGLTIDKGESHGYQSKLICINFFEGLWLKSSINLDAILHAIENHDDKSLRGGSSISDNTSFQLVTIVSTADDLDAFGLIGVFRYIEIYTLRGIQLKELPSKVLQNLKNRFENFKNQFSRYPEFIKFHKERFIKTQGFFTSLDFQVNNNQCLFPELLVTNALIDGLIYKRMGINEIIENALQSNGNANFKHFFSDLKDELDY